jgi:alpha-tubulin suppressor-like RCC1 family protein
VCNVTCDSGWHTCGAQCCRDIAEVATGGNFTCSVDVDGNVKCWGAGANGQSFAVPHPTGVAISGVLHLALGGQVSCALTLAGGVKCWGPNGAGELGNGTTTDSLTAPVDVTGLTSGVKAIGAGGDIVLGGQDQDFACALTNAGGMKCWGFLAGSKVSTATDVAGMTSGVASMCVGADQVCALMTAGSVQCWSSHTPSTRQTITNVMGATSLVCGVNHACALTSSGGVLCWGDDNDGQFGNGVEASSSTTAGVAPTGLAPVLGLTTADDTPCAWTAGGAAYCWGYGGEGALGNGALTNSDVPAGVVGLANGVTQVASSGNSLHVCAVVSHGVQCWGWNNAGQLGDGTNNESAVPVVVSGL